MNRSIFRITLFIIWLCVASIATAAVPQLINYQGRLTNNVGSPLDTTVTVAFTIYGDSLGTSTLWTETHLSVEVTGGLFQVILGSVSSLPQSVFDGSTRWLTVKVEKEPASAPMPLVSSAYAYRSNVTDTAATAKTVSDNAITSAKIQNGTISLADIGQNSATNGEVIKWNGSAWEAQADATSGSGGWTDNGTTVELTTPSDKVAINTALRLGRLNVGGDIALIGQSNIYFGTDSTYIKGYTGGDMTVQCEDHFTKAYGNIYFGHPTDGNWIKFDNANKRAGIGTTTPDDRLHLENDASGGTCWFKIQGSHPTNWGQTGLRIQTPQNTWHLRMDLYTNANFPDGALSLYNSSGGKETMTWLENGNVGIGRTNPLRRLHVDGSALIDDSLGIGTTSPTKKLHVYGSAMVKDTLYAGAINPSLMAASRLPDEPGLALGAGTGGIYLGTNIGTLTTFDSATIVVPGQGYVFACGSVTLESDHSGADNTMVAVWISRQTVYSEDNSQIVTLENSLPTGRYNIPLTTNDVFSVNESGSYKYYMIGARYGDDAINAQHSKLTLIYIPTAYGDTKSAASMTGGDMSESVKALAEARSRAGTQTSQQVDLTSEVRALREEVEALKKELREKK